MRTAPPVELSPQQRTAVERLARQRSLPARVAERARIVLLASDGLENKQIAQRVGIWPEKAARWRNRFLAGGIAALEKDAPQPDRTRTITDRRVKKVVEMTLHQKPVSATHWSTRTMAAAAGISEASVRRIWRANGLKPHKVRTFKLSRDPQFAEKLEDIVGLYLNPPEHALVLCADEKSQIQALDRTQPGLAMKKGRCGTMTHDYKRNGTATLFAALDALEGQVISMCDERHRHQEWRKFLRVIDDVIPVGKEVHTVELAEDGTLFVRTCCRFLKVGEVCGRLPKGTSATENEHTYEPRLPRGTARMRNSRRDTGLWGLTCGIES